MLYMATDPPEVFVQSWLPLYLLCAIRFSRRGSRLWLVLGAAAFALGSAGGDVPFVFNTVFIAALFLAGFALLQILRREGASALRLLSAGAFIFVSGFLLSGVYWSNMAEGLFLLVRDSSGAVAGLTGKGQSLSPLYLITLLIPDFFGGVTSIHSWGAAHAIECTLNDVNLSGGSAGFLVILLGFFATRLSRRGLWAIFLSLFALSLAVVLGVYTPAYGPLRLLVPLFRMPYPVRFRIIECFAFAGLLGLGADGLAAGRPRPRRGIIAALSAALLLALALGLLRSYPAGEGGRVLAGYRLLTEAGEWEWFIRGPLAYAAAVLILLSAAAIHLPPALLPRGLVLLSLAEIVFFAYPAFYRNVVLNRRVQDISGVRFANPRAHPVYRLLESWPSSPTEREEFRRACYRSSFDNLSWVDGGLSLLGFDTKPLLPQFESAVNAVAPGVPYELWPRDWGSRFWTNFSVRLALVSSEERGAAPMVFDLQEKADAIPRFYFQDRWARAGEDEERAAVLSTDLRERGWIAADEAEGLPEALFRPASSADGFARLQEENAIVSRSVSRPNRLLFRVKALRPSLLVLTDAWHPDWRAAVDGRPEKMRRVNCFQRGVFCAPGEHTVEMVFSPRSLRRGWIFTLAGVGAALALALPWGRLAARRLRPGRSVGDGTER
jgi:hypothetical protein